MVVHTCLGHCRLIDFVTAGNDAGEGFDKAEHSDEAREQLKSLFVGNYVKV